MEVLGRKAVRIAVRVGWRAGGCSVRKAHTLGGDDHTRRMSRSCLSSAEAQGIVLACRAFADGDVTLRVIGKMCEAVGCATA